jgi:hypothetical protein
MVTWGANMDMSILIDHESVVSYVAKYCSKSETPSAALSAMLRTTLKNRIDRGQSIDTKKVIRSVFNKTVGSRDKCAMETCHLMNSTPIALCSHSFATINIGSKHREVNNEEGGGEEGVQVIIHTIHTTHTIHTVNTLYTLYTLYTDRKSVV